MIAGIWREKMKTSKSKRVIINRHTGKSHMCTIEVTVPAGRGRKGINGTNIRDDFVLSYMSNLFAAFDECLKEVNGECRIYHGGTKNG